MTLNNLIIVRGGSFADVIKALKQWVKKYNRDLNGDVLLKVYKKATGYHIIQVDGELDNSLFNYLVNYIQYPEDIIYKVKAIGFTTATDSFLYESELIGKRIQVYIPENDTEYDVVYIASDDRNVYKVDFGGKTTKLDFRIDPIQIDPDLLNQSTEPVVIHVNKKEVEVSEEIDDINRIGRRFKLISLIAVTILILTSITIFDNPKLFNDLNFFLNFAIGAWFFIDYRLLRIDRYFIYCLLFACGLLCYGLIVKTLLLVGSVDYFKIGFFHPISILLIQKPLRMFYKMLFKREPVIENPPPTFWDGVYTAILFVAFSTLPLILI